MLCCPSWIAWSTFSPSEETILPILRASPWRVRPSSTARISYWAGYEQRACGTLLIFSSQQTMIVPARVHKGGPSWITAWTSIFFCGVMCLWFRASQWYLTGTKWCILRGSICFQHISAWPIFDCNILQLDLVKWFVVALNGAGTTKDIHVELLCTEDTGNQFTLYVCIMIFCRH